jgi:hypothetical protein
MVIRCHGGMLPTNIREKGLIGVVQMCMTNQAELTRCFDYWLMFTTMHSCPEQS